jgi:hypothetical protein
MASDAKATPGSAGGPRHDDGNRGCGRQPHSGFQPASLACWLVGALELRRFIVVDKRCLERAKRGWSVELPVLMPESLCFEPTAF